MLVLTRKQDQEIIVNENIKISVVRIKGSTVRIGIDAPQSVRIMRGELSDAEAELGVEANAEGQHEVTIDLGLDDASETEPEVTHNVAV